jgi:predicted phosphodiesterase
MDHLTPGTVYDAVVEGILVSSYDVTVLQRFTDFVYQQAARGLLDAVVLTGDIATTGDPEELEKALEFFEAPPDYRLGTQSVEQEPTLAGVSIPILLLPGNHDRYRTGPGYAPGGVGYGPGGQQFDRIFERYWHGPVMPALDSNAIAEYHPICNGDLAVAIISADFNLLTTDDCNCPFGWLAQGKAYDHILGQLVDTTYEIVSRWSESYRLCVIWAIHFPPDFPKISRLMRLIDSDKFVLRANWWDVNAVLAGHTHDPVRYRRPEMKFDVLCAGTVSQAFAPGGNHFRILEIKNDGGEISIASEEYRFRTLSKGMITNRSGFYRL